MLPWLRTVIREHRFITNSMLCSTTRIVLPARLSSLIRSARWPDQRRVDAAGGLVEQQDRRVGDQQRRELEQLALAVGQVAGRLVGEPRDPDELQQLHRVALLALRPGAPQHPAQPALLALRGDQHVLQHRQAGEQPRELERASDPELEHPVGWRVGDLGAAEVNLALLDALVAGDHVEQRRLARAVGADQPVDLALVDVEVAALQRVDAAVGLRDAPDLDQVRPSRGPRDAPAQGRLALLRDAALPAARGAFGSAP